jgi:hypothetical protein
MNHFGIFITAFDVVDSHRETLAGRMSGLDCRQQVGCKRSDAAFARQVVSYESYLANFRGLLHPVSFQRAPQRQKV